MTPLDVSLTARVYEVARELTADGPTNRDIGERLGISEDTVKSHVKELLRLSGCAQRTEFVAKVLRNRVRIHPGGHRSVVEAKEVA